jgi:hypothetical protein
MIKEFFLITPWLKSEARRFLEKSARPPCREIPLNLHAPSRTAVSYLETNCQGHVQICQRPFIYYKQLFATALGTDLEPLSNGAMNIFSPEFSILCRQRRYAPSVILATAQWTILDIGNSTMNSPRYWRWRYEPCAMMLVAMLGPVPISWRLFIYNGETQFSLWKSQYKCCLPLRPVKFHSRVGNSFPNCQQPNEMALTLKGSHRIGDGPIFLKIPAPYSLTTIYRMNLISARSIPLDN